jgi:hypothetical protein
MTTDCESLARHHQLEFVEDLLQVVVPKIAPPRPTPRPVLQTETVYRFGRSLPPPTPIRLSYVMTR